MSLHSVFDDHVLRQYRELLDAEDAAFDELEHAYEDGDRNHFEKDLAAWYMALSRKLAYLDRIGMETPQVFTA
ncbi:MAG: hypothetical protein M1131_01375 [Actinobacteria bacterium]|nr:hypothetical protein [Actinomycetota bacterium]MCL6095662.1 hypothetical protein [Actinomycetota bacterium]